MDILAQVDGLDFNVTQELHNRSDRVLLSCYQRDMWIKHVLNPGVPVCNIGLVGKLKGKLDIPKLKKAVQWTIDSTDILRTTVREDAGQAYLCTTPHLSYDLPIYDNIHTGDFQESYNLGLSWINEQMAKPFDVADRLFEFGLVKIAKDQYLWFTNAHHIILDGWAVNQLHFRIFDKYNTKPLGPKFEHNLSYRYFSDSSKKYQQSNRYIKDKSYWAQEFEDLPEPIFDATLFEQDKVYRHYLSRDFYNEIVAYCQKHGLSEPQFFLGILSVYFSKYYNCEQIIFGLSILNRKSNEMGIIGSCANEIPLRVRCAHRKTFLELVNSIKPKLARSYVHSKLSFGEIQAQFNTSRTHLVDIGFSFEPLDLNLRIEDIETEVSEPKRYNYDTALHMGVNTSYPDKVALQFSYQPKVFTGSNVIENVAQRIERLISACLAHDEVVISSVQVLSKDEQNELLETLCIPPGFIEQRSINDNRCIHNLFEEHAAKKPEHLAVVSGESSISYAELNRRANGLAIFLSKELSIGNESRVGVFIDRSIDFIVAVLGVVKAGAAYVPLDINYPGERLRYIIQDAEIKVVLTTDELRQKVQNYNVMVQCVQHLQSHLQNEYPPDSDVTAKSLAYVIYTSGSTGKPKGVMVEHQSLVSYVYSYGHVMEIDSSDKILQFCSLCFDVSVQDIFLTLSHGATLVLRSDEWLEGAGRWSELCEEYGVTFADLPTIFWHSLALSDKLNLPKCLRRISFGGEAVSTSALQAWWQRAKVTSLPIIWNTYGPAEATIVSSALLCTPDTESQSIGYPVPHAKIYILNQHKQLLAPGILGELYIGGLCLARGYINRRELTEERLVKDPFSSEADARMYKTGDLGRWLPDGSIEFCGRTDSQVKIRGFRIELSEIETALLEVSGVQQAVVAVRHTKTNDNQIVAYIVFEQDNFDKLTIRRQLEQNLPKYMLPSAFVAIQEIPLLPSGKLNRKDLPQPQSTDYITSAYAQPQGDIEERLAYIWSDLLGVEKISRTDDFFLLGGHSLLAMNLCSYVYDEFVVKLDLQTIFTRSEFNDMAGLIIERHNKILGLSSYVAVTEDRTRCEGNIELTLAQRLFFKHQKNYLDDINRWCYKAIFELNIELKKDTLMEILNILVEHHDILRAKFSAEYHTWETDIWTAFIEEHIDVEKYVYELDSVEDSYDNMKIDIELGRTFGFALIQDTLNKKRYLSVIFHHLVSEPQSLKIFFEDFLLLYGLAANNKPLELPRRTASISQWGSLLIEYFYSGLFEENLVYWQQYALWENIQLLPRDYPKTDDLETSQYYRPETIVSSLDVKESQVLLRRVTSKYRTPMFNIILMALTKAVARWSKHKWVEITTNLDGRQIPGFLCDVSRTMGYFTNRGLLLLEDGEDQDLNFMNKQLELIPNYGLGFMFLAYYNDGDNNVNQAWHGMATREIFLNYAGEDEGIPKEQWPLVLKESSVLRIEEPWKLRFDVLVKDGSLVIECCYDACALKLESAQCVLEIFIDVLKKLVRSC